MSTATQIPRRTEAKLVLGNSPAVLSLNGRVAEIAPTDISILLRGESGTGKELYAQLIHHLANLEGTALTKLSCRALDSVQLQKQLESWALPPSARSNDVRGTLYIDEIEDLDQAAQSILLSFLPDGDLTPETGTLPFRLVCSTSRDLERDVEYGKFRRDLFFRINGVTLRLPPLRERKEDIPALMEFFFTKHATGFQKNAPVLGPEEWTQLAAHDWPGNIRELENLAKKMIAFGDAKAAMIDLRAAPSRRAQQPRLTGISSLKVVSRAASRQAEKELILQALERTHWNRKRAARDLQISYKSLLHKIKQIGLNESGSEKLQGGNS